MQPLRQWPCLKSDPRHDQAKRSKEINQFRARSRPSSPSQSSPACPQRNHSTVPMTRRFRHSAPWLSSVSRCLGPTQRRDPVPSSIGGQPHQLPTQSRAHLRHLVRRNPSQGVTGSRLRARSADFSYPGCRYPACRSWRWALAIERHRAGLPSV